MAHRVFLHVGPPKTGTSYLQEIWWHNRALMAEHGVLYPGSRPMSHFQAAAVVSDNRRMANRMSATQLRAWDALIEEIAGFDGDALMSSERFASTSAELADRALRRLEQVADEVHVLATARDLARQVPSSWQQLVKRGGDQPLEEWWNDVAADDGHPFWRFHDVAAVLERWGQGLPPERVHLVVHGPPGSPPDLLLERACGVIGLDPGLLSPTGRGNESLGAVEVELLRRINAHRPPEAARLAMVRLTKAFFTRQLLAPAGQSDRFVLSAEGHERAVRRGCAIVDRLRRRDYDVVGDLDDLLPAPQPRAGRDHVDVSDSEIAELATAVFARVLDHELESRRQRNRLRRAVRRRERELSRLRSPQRKARARAVAGLRRLRAAVSRG